MVKKKVKKGKKKSTLKGTLKLMESKVASVAIDKPFHSPPKTFGQKAADALTKWAGSWFFIIFLGVFMLIWISVNTSWLLFGKEWDPYPFILLNFVLSTLAAIQAPIILMSQNREAQKDRARAEYDYKINKKAEQEIREIKTQLRRIENTLLRKKK